MFIREIQLAATRHAELLARKAGLFEKAVWHQEMGNVREAGERTPSARGHIARQPRGSRPALREELRTLGWPVDKMFTREV